MKRLLPLGEKALFLKEHSLKLPASFSLGVVSLPQEHLALYVAFSLRGSNPSLGEFILPFEESLISLENRLCCSIPCCIPFFEFLPDGGSVLSRPKGARDYTRTLYLHFQTLVSPSLITVSNYRIQKYKIKLPP